MSNAPPTQADILQQCQSALDEFTRRLDEWQEEKDAWDAEGDAIDKETTRQVDFFRRGIDPSSEYIEWNGTAVNCNTLPGSVVDCVHHSLDNITGVPQRVKCEAQRRFGHITARGNPPSSFSGRGTIEPQCFGLDKTFFNSLDKIQPQKFKTNVFNNGLVENLPIDKSAWTPQKQAERDRIKDNWEARKPIPPALPPLICQFCEQNVTVDDVLESTVQLDQLLEMHCYH